MDLSLPGASLLPFWVSTFPGEDQKASTEHKRIFDWDMAFQVEVARRAGLNIVGAGVFLLDRTYVRGETLDVYRLLGDGVDLSAEVGLLAGDVQREIAGQLRILAQGSVAPARPGPHCKANPDAAGGDRPSACGHLEKSGYCGKDLPKYWAGRLPRLLGAKATQVHAMVDPSIDTLDPNDGAMNWTAPQRRVITAVRSGGPVINGKAMHDVLEHLRWPVAYLDFEFDPGMAVPRFPGTRSYDRIPFQWSMRVQRTQGGPLESPLWFLHIGEEDPRGPFLDSLLAALPDPNGDGSVVVYSRTAEATVLNQLCDGLSEERAQLVRRLIANLFDAKDVVEAGYYHPDQQGSYSLKQVAPVLVGRGYDDLDVRDGMAAVVEWKRASKADCKPGEREAIRQNLLNYCGRDAELMHAILEAIRCLPGVA